MNNLLNYIIQVLWVTIKKGNNVLFSNTIYIVLSMICACFVLNIKIIFYILVLNLNNGFVISVTVRRNYLHISRSGRGFSGTEYPTWLPSLPG
ncbi:MAG TPA: hypothetical protein DCO75_12320 [Fibrobacteres bacterium]|nr:hypothetical protein [Fibrobacterota bacterium]